MFGNSKEYQDLQKLYVDEVSKPENIDEFFGLGKKKKEKKKEEEIVGKEKSNDKENSTTIKGFTPSKEIKAEREKIIKQREESRSKVKGIGPVVDDPITPENEKKKYGEKLNQIKANKEAEAKKKAEANKKEVEFRLKNTESSEQSAKVEKPEPAYKSRVTGADRAKALAKARIKSGKTIADVKASNTQSMKDAARARNDAFKAKRASRNLDKQLDFDDPAKGNFGLSNSRGKSVKKLGKPQPKVKSPMDMRGESYEPYDIVLEYLLSSQQAATIEEANYIMTEMDAKTIQDIVAQQLNEQN